MFLTTSPLLKLSMSGPGAINDDVMVSVACSVMKLVAARKRKGGFGFLVHDTAGMMRSWICRSDWPISKYTACPFLKSMTFLLYNPVTLVLFQTFLLIVRDLISEP